MIYILFLIISIVGVGGFGYLSYYNFFFIDTANYLLGTVFLIISIVFIILSMLWIFLFVTKKNRVLMADMDRRLHTWSDIALHVSNAGEEAVNNMPIGIISYDEYHTIKWSNIYTKTIFGGDINEKSLQDVSKDLYDSIASDVQKNSLIIKVGDKSYDVINNLVIKSSYLFEVTERELIKKRYDERITGICFIEIENLDEALKKLDMQAKTKIRGEILGAVSDWISKYKAYLQSITGDRMIIVFDKESLHQMIEDKFSILSKVRDIAKRDKLITGLSMGLACADKAYEELGTIAQSALDLALKRGGDQAVVNTVDKPIQFFGGLSNSAEKSTFIETRNQSIALRSAVMASTNVLIMCHNFADCDALGSMLAAFYMVSISKKETKMVFDINRADATVKKAYNKLINIYPDLVKNFISIDKAMQTLSPNTLLIITDTQSPKLLMFKELYEKASKVFIIDHHRVGDPGYRDDYLSDFRETSASSSVEMITEMFSYYKTEGDEEIFLGDKELEKEIEEKNKNSVELVESPTKAIASMMLAGIVVDTNNFTMRSGERTFQVAAELRSRGADMLFVRQILQEDINDEKVLADAITRTEVLGNKFGIVCLEETTLLPDRTTLAKISDRQLTISGIAASFTIGRINADTIGISARSLGNEINVQSIMEEMGGGGHYNSAASQIKDPNLKIVDVREQIISIITRDYISGDGGKSKMDVILLEDIKGKGNKDEIVSLANGYANFLITNKKAVAATEENKIALEKKKAKEKQDAENKRKLLMKLKSEIDGKSINVKIKVGSAGKTFGHVTTKLICDEFEAQTGIHLDKKKVEMPGDITTIGIYTISVKLESDIIANFEVKVEEKD